jgi:hypothetical protein
LKTNKNAFESNSPADRTILDLKTLITAPRATNTFAADLTTQDARMQLINLRRQQMREITFDIAAEAAN